MRLAALGFVVLIGCPKPVPVLADAGSPALDAQAEASPPPAEQACRDDAGIWHLPNPAWTPGKVCTQGDPNFKEMRYSKRVAYCVRYVTASEKDKVAKVYGISKEDYKKYEFDHFIPLNAGGSDDQTNVWPQPIDEAREKDKLEIEIYNALADGTIDQDEAIAKIRAWRPASCAK